MSVDEAKGSWARDPLFALGVLASAGVLLAFAWPLLLGEVYVHSDLGRFHVPMRHFFAEALAQGDSFLWVPYEFTGFYLHGEGQAVLAHPLNLLQYWLLPFRAAFAVELLRSYVFMVFGTFLLLRRFGSDRPGAAFGALAFTFGSFNFLHFMHMNFTGIVSHVPWILLAADVALESRSVRAVATARLGIALLVASQLLHSHPQVTWMSLVVLGIYSVHWMLRADASGAGASDRRAGRDAPARRVRGRARLRDGVGAAAAHVGGAAGVVPRGAGRGVPRRVCARADQRRPARRPLPLLQPHRRPEHDRLCVLSGRGRERCRSSSGR